MWMLLCSVGDEIAGPWSSTTAACMINDHVPIRQSRKDMGALNRMARFVPDQVVSIVTSSLSLREATLGIRFFLLQLPLVLLAPMTTLLVVLMNAESLP